MKSGITNLWGNEPALILGLVQAGIVLVMAFGLQLTVEQVGAIMAFINILLAVLTRTQVVPTTKIVNAGIDPNSLPNK